MLEGGNGGDEQLCSRVVQNTSYFQSRDRNWKWPWFQDPGIRIDNVNPDIDTNPNLDTGIDDLDPISIAIQIPVSKQSPIRRPRSRATKSLSDQVIMTYLVDYTAAAVGARLCFTSAYTAVRSYCCSVTNYVIMTWSLSDFVARDLGQRV